MLARPRACVRLAAAALALAGAAVPAAATPTVIRDNRLRDLAITPTLGRGYSPSANLLHSVCFDTMPTTTASFDFDYTFEQLELDTTSSSQRTGAYKGSEVDEFVRTNTRDRVVVRGNAKLSVRYLLATLSVDSYYSSIDESKAHLSDQVMQLLRAGDALGFFSGCGTHYIRSVSRRSYFLTLFSYTTSSTSRDNAFERRLEQSVRRFDVDGKQSSAEKDEASKFDEEAKSHDLKIVSKAIGLVAQHDASLIPFDLTAYKETIKSAFKSSQDEFVGRVTSIEVTPWLANPLVLATLDLPPPGNTDAARMSHFERKQQLADNAEFYVAAAARTDELEQLVRKAGVCRQHLDRRVLVGGAVPPELAKAQVINHRTGERMPLTALVEALSKKNLDELEAAERDYAFGTDDKPGAAECIHELERTQLVGRSHADIPACSAPDPPLPSAAPVIDDYCLPELVQADKP